MIKRLLFTVLFISSLFITSANSAETFMLLDNTTYAGPFSEDAPITVEFTNSAGVGTVELLVHFTDVIPDRAVSEVRYKIYISVEGQTPSGLWYVIATDPREFNSSEFYPTRKFVFGKHFIRLNGQTYQLGNWVWGIRATYSGEEIPENLRLVFRVTPDPFDPPRYDDLQSFTVSVSGREWID
jgi:hypothetical protein